MLQRLINAIQSQSINNFFNNPLNFPMLLKGGYEDTFSLMLFLQGFNPNNDIVSQYSLGNHAKADIGILNNGVIEYIIEFGHQFSLQFGNANSGLQKLKDTARSRLQQTTVNAELYCVQIITDIIDINNLLLPKAWYNYYENTRNWTNSINDRNEALNMINNIKSLIDQFMTNHQPPFNPPLINTNGQLITINVNNINGQANINFIINGPYNFDQRVQI